MKASRKDSETGRTEDNLWKTCGKVENPVENRAKHLLTAIREAGGICFFHPGKPIARLSGIHQASKDKVAKGYQENMGWGAKCAANANGPDWCKQHIPMQGAVVLGVTVFRALPVTNKPDLDNYVKLVADAMQEARIYIDDSHVAEYFPGTCKRESKTEGIRVIIVPQIRMAGLGFEVIDEF